MLHFLLAAATAASLSAFAQNPPDRFAGFTARLDEIRQELRIPALAAAVVQEGRIVWTADLGANASTAFPIASVTKTMTAALVLQLVEEGRLSLDQPATAQKDVTVRHLLSHTSEGTPGSEYLYSGSRYNALGPLIEKAAGKPFAEALRERVLGRVGDTNMSAPGATASWGVVATSRDLAKYVVALDAGHIVSAGARSRMFEPTRSTSGAVLPYGLGWFTQTYLGERIVWHYGQDDDCGSLLMYLPARHLGLVVLMSSAAASDASRLLDGNVARSPIALAFVEHVLGRGAERELERDRLISRALMDLFMENPRAASWLRTAAEKFPDLARHADLPLLYVLARVADPSLNALTGQVADAVLAEHPDHPPVLYFSSLYYERIGNTARAIEVLTRLTRQAALPRHFSVAFGLESLGRLAAESNPALARTALERLIAMNYDFGGAAARARELLARLPQ